MVGLKCVQGESKTHGLTKVDFCSDEKATTVGGWFPDNDATKKKHKSEGESGTFFGIPLTKWMVDVATWSVRCTATRFYSLSTHVCDTYSTLVHSVVQ